MRRPAARRLRPDETDFDRLGSLLDQAAMFEVSRQAGWLSHFDDAEHQIELAAGVSGYGVERHLSEPQEQASGRSRLWIRRSDPVSTSKRLCIEADCIAWTALLVLENRETLSAACDRHSLTCHCEKAISSAGHPRGLDFASNC